MSDFQSELSKITAPDRVISYFRMEWKTLFVVTISGIFYNVGLLAGPWFEGMLAQCLFDIFGHEKQFSDMLALTFLYVAVIAAVQTARYLKRLYVRRFANNVNRNMKHILYGNLVHKSKSSLDRENVGSVMTKAISDVDACVEGMRKFTTELFDTGVALLGYAVFLLWYDWRLALLSMIFPPFSYLIAEKMKVIVQKTGAAYKESAGNLSAATLDRASNGLTYRVFGCEQERDLAYEKHLDSYEKAAIKANIWVSAMPPLYHVISMASTLFILYFGAKNVAQTGWTSWNIAAFTTFLSCYTKMSVKSAKAAKLFNSVQKAQVSWKRIKPLMKQVPKETVDDASSVNLSAGSTNLSSKNVSLSMENVGFAYPGSVPVFEGLSLSASPGQIIGITGPVASGKSTLGKVFLQEFPYKGSIRLNGQELSRLPAALQNRFIGYLGHDPELLSDTLKDNILLGKDGSAAPWLTAVCFDREAAEMPDQENTLVGNSGIRLSGGQQSRLALARTLAHKKPILVLDDPFSALDQPTEKAVFENLKALASDSIILLISHRLYLFPQTDQVIWIDHGKTTVGTHESFLKTNGMYADLYQTQCKGGNTDEA